jgi:hypothetical protein
MNTDFATFIPVTGRNAGTRWSGRILSPGAVLAKLPEAEYNNQTKPNTTIRALLVPLRAVQDMTRLLSAGRADLELPTWSAPQPSSWWTRPTRSGGGLERFAF